MKIIMLDHLNLIILDTQAGVARMTKLFAALSSCLNVLCNYFYDNNSIFVVQLNYFQICI